MKILCNNCREILSAAAGEFAVCGKCGGKTEIPQGAFMPGTVVADFVISRQLTRGNMGTIYLAEHIVTKKKIALKILSEDHTYDAKYIVSFIHSARLAMKTQFDNVVQVCGVGEDEGVFYYAMEYVEGKSLTDILNNEGALPVQRSFEIVHTIASTMAEAWNHGRIIHRSITPDNILFTADGELKLADFGLARDYFDLAVRSDEDQIRLVQYAPPELLSDFSMMNLDTRSDIYSLGAVFYHCVTGTYPYQNFSISEIISGNVPIDFVEPAHLNPEVSPAVQAIIRKMLARNPKERYQTFQELLKDLDSLDLAVRQVPNKRNETKTHDSVTIKIGAGKRAKAKDLDKMEHSISYLDHLQRKRESRAQTIVLGIAGVLLCLGIFASLFIKWIVYEPRRSAREMEINIARMKERTRRQKSLYQPLQKGAVERLCRGVIAHCSNEDFLEAQRFIREFSKKYYVDPDFKKELLRHVRSSRLFFRQFTNSGGDLAGVEFYSRLYGCCTVIYVKDSVITAKKKDGKQVSVQIRTFTHPEYRSYLENVVARCGLRSESRSYLLCTGNFESALKLVKGTKDSAFFEKVTYGYIRAGLSNASPLEIRQMRMLYGSLDAFQKATHPKK